MFCDTLPLQLLSKIHFFWFFWNGVDLPPSYLDNVFKYTVFFLEITPKGTLFSQTLKVEGNNVPFVFSIFDQGLRYGQSKNFEVFPFDVTYWIMSTLEAALPDWFGQKYLTRCLKYQNGMGLTWELINPRNFDFLCPLNRWDKNMFVWACHMDSLWIEYDLFY